MKHHLITTGKVEDLKAERSPRLPCFQSGEALCFHLYNAWISQAPNYDLQARPTQQRAKGSWVVTLVSVNDTFTLSPSPLSTPTTTRLRRHPDTTVRIPRPGVGDCRRRAHNLRAHTALVAADGDWPEEASRRGPEGTEAGGGEGDVFDDLVEDGGLFFPDGVGVGEKGVEGEEELSHRLPPLPLRQPYAALASVEAGGGAGGADGSKGGHAGVGGPVARSHREQEKERKRREKEERTLVFT
ncbi:hypothetical protein Scep_008326 [Stephania cephalantha]|uniref:Uncharacterized protein n=1 Tax=Stephania cephalantha TaxID=152367 RepID=A0AAP0KDF3_9MAGN